MTTECTELEAELVAYNEDAGNPSLPSKATKMTRKLLFVEASVSFVVSSPFKS